MIHLLFVAVFGFAPLAAAPQVATSPSPTPATGASDQSRALELLVRAREDPAVQRAEAEFEQVLRSAMQQLDPDVTAREARAHTLRAEAAAAEEAGDAHKRNLLAQEAAELRRYFTDLSRRAAQEPAVSAAKQRHEDAMMARMIELDPEAPALIERVRGALAR